MVGSVRLIRIHTAEVGGSSPLAPTRNTLVRALRPLGMPIAITQRARHVRDGIRLFRGERVRTAFGSQECGGTRFVGEGVEGVVELLFGTWEQVSVPVECEAHRRVARSGGNLLGVGTGGDPEGDSGVPKIVGT